MRTFDAMSGSQPKTHKGLLARAPRMTLHTKEARRETLATHADHRKWTDTPYISFTKFASAI